jgi:hypothetical protein
MVVKTFNTCFPIHVVGKTFYITYFPNHVRDQPFFIASFAEQRDRFPLQSTPLLTELR